jgi:dTDP-4-dehydrorhamnose reductase
MKVLVTGGKGQLSRCLKKTQPATVNAEYPAREELDLNNPLRIREQLLDIKPDFVMNAAAYTKVDLAEKEAVAAFAANELAVKTLGSACAEIGTFLIHISTDFVFHGEFNRPIDEFQRPNPVGVYAQSKAAGEAALLAIDAPGAIVRTSWLYSEFNSNFMKTMLRLGREKSRLTVIADQHGSPTYAVDLAQGLWQMIAVLSGVPRVDSKLIYHFSNYGVTTWYDFAKSIFEIAKIDTQVEPILTQEYPVATPRPAYSALWPRKFANDFQFPIRHWRVALNEAITAFERLSGENP